MSNTFADRHHALCRILDDDDPLQVLDVGANPMHFDTPYKALHDLGSVTVTGFDPQKDTLKQLQSDSPDQDRFLPYAIGDGAAHQLNIYQGSGLTSLLQIRRATLFFMLGLKRAARLVGTETFQTKRLDDVAEIADVDLLKIDIQGAEKMVFENGSDTLSKAVAVHSEVSFFPLYENQPSFGEVDVALRKHGFVPHSFYHTVSRFVRSSRMNEPDDLKPTQLLDGDIIYFRDLSRPDLLSDNQLHKLAVISNGVYAFFDYTLRCLDELEKRGAIKADHIPDYVATLKR